MIPASYFFKNAQCRQWEHPEVPEGVAIEPVRKGKRGWFRSLVGTFRVHHTERHDEQCSEPGHVSTQRG